VEGVVTTYAQCNGEGLRICASCRRYVENNPPADKWQPHLKPTTSGERCGDWLAKRDLNESDGLRR